MNELIRVRVQYASRQQCCKTHKTAFTFYLLIPIKLEFRASVGFIYKESVTMHDHTIVKCRIDNFKFKCNLHCTLRAQIICAKVQPQCNLSVHVTNSKVPNWFLCMNKTVRTFFPANATITFLCISFTATEQTIHIFTGVLMSP